MIKPYKGRVINNSKKVEVYRNLHNNCFSIRQDGLVVAHANNFVIENTISKVSERGRQRVLKEKRKNVHAYLIGVNPTGVLLELEYDVNDLVEIYYNPYKYSYFINNKTKEKFESCDKVYFIDGKAYIVE